LLYNYRINGTEMTFTLRPHQQRALDALTENNKGCVYIPTGGGKTLIMIEDVKRRLIDADSPKTVVVVAPRILLAVQLFEEFFAELNGKVDVSVLHVHSGEVECNRTTKVQEIECHHAVCKTAGVHELIFTTYHSLGRIVDSGIDVDFAYFDEAHNATNRGHFVGVAATSMGANNAYFFTATPKFSRNPYDRGMNNPDVFGNTILSVPAPELINNGSIVAPKIVPHVTSEVRTKHNASEIDCETVCSVLDGMDATGASKVLVAAPSTRVLWRMLTTTDVIQQMRDRGYDILHITSKHGAYVNQTKVSRDKFFETLQQWGKDKNRKFVLFHYSILSEGINVPGLTHTILLRQLPVIEMAQTIGRVIRMDSDDANDIASGRMTAGVVSLYRKQAGYVTVPVHGKTGIHTAKRLQNVVDTIFVKGLPAHSTF
jgi:superfamily II DNA or RNA helicase